MEDNIFLKDRKELKLADYMMAQENGRENLGSELPVAVYRLLEYSIREELKEQFGKEEQIRIFRNAGYRAGVYFAEKYLDSSLEISDDEGFLAGILTSYTGKPYTAIEVNCWATGDRVCRFQADINE